MSVDLLNLSPAIDKMRPELRRAMDAVLDHGKFILGPEVKAFESLMAERLGITHAIGVNSGTDALVIALRSLGVKPGDEVIVPAFTFYATAEAVSQCGAVPIFADVLADTMCIDPESIRSKLTDKTTCLIPVHLFGHPADMDAIMAIANEHDVRVLEDVAQAAGATYHDAAVGGIGDAGAWSFFPSKNLGGFGDGGLISTDSQAVAELALSLRHHGAGPGGKYDNIRMGYNSRLDTLQAAMLHVAAGHLDHWNAHRQAIADAYAHEFEDMSGVVLPTILDGCTHVFHQYTVRIPSKRDQVQAALQSAGIGHAVYYPTPVHRLPVYNEPAGSCPVAESLANEVISLPMGPHMTAEMVKEVAAQVRAALSA